MTTPGPCATRPWCAGHARPGDPEHHGSVHVVPARGGRELRLALGAHGAEPAFVVLEATMTEQGPAMSVAELDLTDALRLGGVLRQLTIEGREGPPDDEADPPGQG